MISCLTIIGIQVWMNNIFFLFMDQCNIIKEAIYFQNAMFYYPLLEIVCSLNLFQLHR